jgi:hypothetical protein
MRSKVHRRDLETIPLPPFDSAYHVEIPENLEALGNSKIQRPVYRVLQ